MITSIDHIVIAVHSLERAIATYRDLGFTVIIGGQHPYGSRNALIGFADGSYIELLAFYEDSPNHPWWDLLHQRGGGLIDFCMATDAIRADLARLDQAGIDIGELTEGGRHRPDGYHVRWINNKVGGLWQGLVPFLIEDLTPRRERLPAETSHANGVTGMHTLRLATRDASSCADVMGAALGQSPERFADDSLNASGVRFEVGSHVIEYLQPLDDMGDVAAHLKENRSPPFSVSFRATGANASFAPDQTEGLRIALVAP